MISFIKGILNHPLNKGNKTKAFLRFLGWQIQSRTLGTSRIINITEKSRMYVIPGRPASTAHLYCGLFEFEDEAFLIHFLRREDLFVDIGANVGVYSILSSAHCKARSIAIEPIPDTIELLKKNIELNDVENLVRVKNCGVSSKPGQILFTTSLDSENHVKSNQDDQREKYLEIPTLPLDEILALEIPSLLKIDVEGFEQEVLSGGTATLTNDVLKAIIIELNGSGMKYGFHDEDIDTLLLRHGFKVYSYNPYTRELVESGFSNAENTLYIRDYDFVSERLKNAESFNIQGILI
jgi:FkbM family methyltransferase